MTTTLPARPVAPTYTLVSGRRSVEFTVAGFKVSVTEWEDRDGKGLALVGYRYLPLKAARAYYTELQRQEYRPW
jgi:hypothetical protein